MTANGGARPPERALTLVIGALGGEGGGVLTDWIVKAAEAQNFPTQSTSIPGVAQRTGATTYYVEIYPAAHDALGGRRPVMGLYATPGNMDVVVTSELMEAGRMLELGLVTPDRTTLIASSHRVYSILEKSAMGDGLFDGSKVVDAAEKLARRSILFDMNALAERQGSVLNAVALGVLAGSGELPVPADAFERSIESAGVAVESNLRGFRAGLACIRGELAAETGAGTGAGTEADTGAPDAAGGGLDGAVGRGFPPETHGLLDEGVRRLTAYQDAAYAGLYLDRLGAVLAADKAAGGVGRGFRLTAETGRYLALWMSFEDIIRVADLKSRPERMARVRAEVGAKAGEPVAVTEFLKPGFEELASVMPPRLGRRIAAWAARSPRRRAFHLAMRVRTDTVFGFLRLWLLARLKAWRPRSYRYAEEQAGIESWLAAVVGAAAQDYQLALETAELPNLRKGYSDTHRRGVRNYRRIFEAVAEPASRGAGDAASAAARLRAAREAALADPDGRALDDAMAAPPTAVPAEAPRAAAE